ncbi:C1q domain containing protein [uncultured Caudovirales phage]|uniref:C1q domain containing protein n=1 Tax=uncultured Caudovirales phage TaxID=2100421 RepID=A0A6J7WB68_9CAUD|nr:C1q domain containing protein [uncultured Caudovirales phage]
MTTLTPTPKQQFLDANGNPLSGGKVYTYAAGTTTPLVTYTDQGGSTPNTNPVILDSRGEAAIWLGVASYKLKLTTSTDVEIWTVDNIVSASVQALANLSESGGSALVGYLPAGTGAVATTVQAKLRETVSVKDFGATGDGVTDDSAALQTAINAVGAGGKLYIPKGTYVFATGLTRGSAITIQGDGCSGAGGTTLKYTGSGNAFTYNGGGSATGGRFQDFVLQGTASANNGVYISNAFNNILFDKVYVTDFSKASANAVYIEDAWDITFFGCYFRGSYNGVKCGIGATYAVVNACKWIGCEFIEITNVGFTLTSGSGNLLTGCDFSGQVGQIQVDLAPVLTAGTNRACNANVIENCYMEGGNVTDDTAIRIGYNATIGTSLLQGNVLSNLYMDWDGDYIHVYNALGTVIRDPKIGTVQATKKAIKVDATATYTKVEWQRRANITDSATTTQYITQDLITLTEAQGNYTSPNKSAFQARASADILNVTGNATVYSVILNTTIFDNQTEYSTTTGLFTAQKTGKYLFACQLSLGGMTGATFAQLRLVTSNRTYDLGTFGNGALSGATLGIGGSAVADLDAADTAKLTVEVTGIGANSADILANNSYFSGCLVG